MKHLHQLSLAVLAILTAMNFAACSDDDNNEGGQGGNAPGTSGKQLVWFREGGAGEDEDYVDMHYGSDGWLNTAYSSYGREDDIMYRYESDGGKYTIATSYWSDGGIACEFTFDNLLRRIDGEPCEYDAEGHLISCGDYTFVWEGGNIVRCEDGYDAVEYTYYTNQENKSPVYPDPLAETLEDFFIQAHPQLLGTWSKNLVKTMTSSYDGETITWEYTLDSDGYVTGVKQTDRDDYSYEYRWE